MKTSLLVGVILSLAVSVHAEPRDVRVADDLQRVLDVLGPPQGSIAMGSYRLLYFDRGRVELRDDRVTSVELVSAEEAAQRRLLEQLRQAEAEKRAAQQRRLNLAEGTALRAAKLADPAFMASPATARVAYWRDFQRRYPDVPLGPEYAAALGEAEAEYETARADAERRRELEALEARVAAAERKAREAEERSRYSYVYCPAPRVIYTPVDTACSTRHGSRVGVAMYPSQHRAGLSFTYRSSPSTYHIGLRSSTWSGAYCP